MPTRRKLAAFVVAAGLPLGLLVSLSTTGTASATTAKGTVSCSSLAATITFKPPLLPQGTSPEKSTIKPITLGGCVSNGTSVTIAKATATLTVVGTNSCATFASNVGSDSLSLVVKWSGVSATKVSFMAGTLGVNSDDSGFVASGGKATGSYKTAAASFSADMSTANQSQLVPCIAGSGSLASIQIVSGSANL